MTYLDKLAKAEAFFRHVFEGERQTAELAQERILTKISGIHAEHPGKHKISLGSYWKKQLFVKLCTKYGQGLIGLSSKVLPGKISENMIKGASWNEFLRYAKILEISQSRGNLQRLNTQNP